MVRGDLSVTKGDVMSGQAHTPAGILLNMKTSWSVTLFK